MQTTETSRLRAALARDGVTVRDEGIDGLTILGLDSTAVGHVIADQGIAISELETRRNTLEQTFMELTSDSVEYSARAIHEVAA